MVGHQLAQVYLPLKTHQYRYSDVEHTVRPVLSGHRLVLTYNLVHAEAGIIQPASVLNEDQSKLARLLMDWSCGYKDETLRWPEMLAYMLDHKYTDAKLRLDHLKGIDRLKAGPLHAACENNDFCFFLANLEHTQAGGCEESYDPYDHYGGRRGYNWRGDDSSEDEEEEEDSEAGDGDHHALDEIYDTTLELRTLFRANGEQVATSIEIEEADIVQEDSFDRDPHDEDYEGYTGNAGASATHFYRNSCIILMPRRNYIPFLMQAARKGHVDIERWMGCMSQDLRIQPEDRRLREELICICNLIAKANQAHQKDSNTSKWSGKPPFDDATLGVVARASVQLENPPIFECAVRATKEGLPVDVYTALGALLGKADLAQWHQR